MAKKPRSTNAIKNRHIQKEVKERQYSDYDFSDFTKHLQKYCTVDELAEAFVPTKVPQTIDPITRS